VGAGARSDEPKGMRQRCTAAEGMVWISRSSAGERPRCFATDTSQPGNVGDRTQHPTRRSVPDPSRLPTRAHTNPILWQSQQQASKDRGGPPQFGRLRRRMLSPHRHLSKDWLVRRRRLTLLRPLWPWSPHKSAAPESERRPVARPAGVARWRPRGRARASRWRRRPAGRQADRQPSACRAGRGGRSRASR
jgi:hypothetical protein